MSILENNTISQNNDDMDISSTISSLVVVLSSYIANLAMVAHYMRLIKGVIICPLGIIGAVVSILVFRFSSFPSSGFSIYMTAVAVGDLLRVALSFQEVALNVYITPRTDLFCQITTYLSHLAIFISYACVTGASVDRMLAVVVPHKVKILSSETKAKRVTYIIILTGIIVNVPAPFAWNGSNTDVCVQSRDDTAIIVYFGIISVIYNIFTFIVILVCTVIISCKLTAQHKKIVSHNTAQTETKMAKKEAQITAMLLAIALLFIVTTLPLVIYFMFGFIYPLDTMNPADESVHSLLYHVAVLLSNINHSANVFAYCVSAEMFRKELVKLCKNALRKCA